MGFPGGASGQELAFPCRRHEMWVRSVGGKIPWRRAWQPTPVFLPWESHGQRSLEGYSPGDCKESHVTERQSMLWGLSELIHISIHSSVWYHKMTFLLVLLLMLESLLQIIPKKKKKSTKFQGKMGMSVILVGYF